MLVIDIASYGNAGYDAWYHVPRFVYYIVLGVSTNIIYLITRVSYQGVIFLRLLISCIGVRCSTSYIHVIYHVDIYTMLTSIPTWYIPS